MARAAQNRVEPALTLPDAERAEPPEGPLRSDEEPYRRLSPIGSPQREDAPAFPEAPHKNEAERVIAPRTQSNRSLLVAGHFISAAAGAALMWYVMGEPGAAQRATTPATGVPGAVMLFPDAANPRVAPPAVAPAVAGDSQVRDVLERWRQSWSDRAVDAYLGFYSAHFVPADGTKRSVWAEGRRKNLLSRSKISIQLHDVTLIPIDSRQTKVTLRQDYASDGYTEIRRPKTFLLAREGNDWRIVREWQGTRSPLPTGQHQRH